MKNALSILPGILRWIAVFLIALFSLATLLGGSYFQTLLLWLLAISMAYWPVYVGKKWGRSIALGSRITIISILLVGNIMVFQPDPKESIYTSKESQGALMDIYNQRVRLWPEDTEDIFIQSKYGKVHILACGEPGNPPLVMIHAASMGAHSWAENLAPLLPHYRIYSIDNIGEGNKSELDDAMVYPATQKQIADHFVFIMDELGIENAPVFGASNGGYIAASFAYYYPGKVKTLCLFGPMGLTRLKGNSILMLSVSSMYPFQIVREWVSRWALGDDENIDQIFGDWFNWIMKGTIPSVGMPVPMTSEQKAEMDIPVLLFLGTKDKIVGDAVTALQIAEEYPNIQIEVLESGHLIAVEHASYVNKVVSEFLLKN